MKDMNCSCGGVAVYKNHLKFNRYDLDGWKCKKCGEIYYNPEKAERILLLNKLKKIKYNLKLSKVKSNLVLRIPKEVGEALNLHKGANIELGLKDMDEIVLHPISASEES